MLTEVRAKLRALFRDPWGDRGISYHGRTNHIFTFSRDRTFTLCWSRGAETSQEALSKLVNAVLDYRKRYPL